MTNLNIELYKRGNSFYAEIPGLPGSPPIGTGKTGAMAVACLFHRLITCTDTPWLTYMGKFDGNLMINGRPWTDIPGASKR